MSIVLLICPFAIGVAIVCEPKGKLPTIGSRSGKMDFGKFIWVIVSCVVGVYTAIFTEFWYQVMIDAIG